MSIRVVVAEDHLLVRQSLRAILEDQGLDIVGDASDGQEAVRLCRELRPDVAVLDISMPLLNGIEAAREIAKESPDTRIVHLTMHPQDQFVLQSLQAGVTGYLLKENAVEELVAAIRTVVKGGLYVTSSASRSVVQLFLKGTGPARDPLTSRERQVLQLIAEGKNMKEIGGLLGVSGRTAHSHRAKIMAKLGVHDTASLVRYAVAVGLVPGEERLSIRDTQP
jgi:DNA-binding NarL/FixJ family response regulator